MDFIAQISVLKIKIPFSNPTSPNRNPNLSLLNFPSNMYTLNWLSTCTVNSKYVYSGKNYLLVSNLACHIAYHELNSPNIPKYNLT
jgi:hypothetical protein